MRSPSKTSISPVWFGTSKAKDEQIAGQRIDPLEVIDQYGADAMNFTLSYMATQGQDILIDMDTFRLGSRFANKVWNAARFVLLNIGGVTLQNIEEIKLNTIDKWIYHRFNQTVRKVHAAMNLFKFNEGSQAVTTSSGTTSGLVSGSGERGDVLQRRGGEKSADLPSVGPPSVQWR